MVYAAQVSIEAKKWNFVVKIRCLSPLNSAVKLSYQCKRMLGPITLVVLNVELLNIGE